MEAPSAHIEQLQRTYRAPSKAFSSRDHVRADPLARNPNALGGALAVAENLPDQVGAFLVSKWRDAFVEAFQTTAIISAAITLIAALATVLILRRRENEPG